MSISSLSDTSGPQRRHSGWSLVILATAQLIISLDLNIVFVALPAIGSSLGFSGQTLQWVVSAYTVFCGGFLLLGGRAADLLGQRRMFMLALLLYAASSLAGGLATTPALIIGARAVQGIGGALLFPATLSLINTLFEEGPRRNRALAVWGGAGASGLTIGSILGGVLTQWFGWPAVFFVNVPLACLVALAAWITIPRDRLRLPRGGFDLPGAVLATGGATLLVYALVQGPEAGWSSPAIRVSLLLAAALLAAFIAVEKRSADPLMPLRLFRNRNLLAGMTITFIYMGSFGALPYFLTLLLQDVLHFSPLQTGLAFLVPSIAIAAGTQVGERLATSLATRVTLLIGLITGALGTLVMMYGANADAVYLMLVPGLIVSGVGQGISWTAMWIAAASGVAHEDQGIASGIASTTLNIGNGVGMAILIAIANSYDQGVDTLRTALADGTRTAFLFAAAAMLAGLLVAWMLPRRA